MVAEVHLRHELVGLRVVTALLSLGARDSKYDRYGDESEFHDVLPDAIVASQMA
jgi:hypothetical protein